MIKYLYNIGNLSYKNLQVVSDSTISANRAIKNSSHVPVRQFD